MEAEEKGASEGTVIRLSVEAAIRIGILAAIAAWAFLILRPFIPIVLWAIILAVALSPVHTWLSGRLGHRARLAAVLLSGAGLALLLLPSIRFFSATIEEVRIVVESLREGTLSVPPPPESVREWPLVGERVFAAWDGASKNLEAALVKIGPELRTSAEWALSALAGLAGTVVQFLISFLIMGVLFATADRGRAFSDRLAIRLAGPQGPRFVVLSVATIRSVFQGVLGIAVVQATLSAIGLLFIGVPAALLWSLAVLVLAIVQLPPLLVMGPISVWVFAHESTTIAVLFAIYALLVSSSDTFLKPLLLGRGVDVPMLVILLGAIGGMLMSGIMGLFLGAVILAIAYQLFMAWIEGDADRRLISSPTVEPSVAAEERSDRTGSA